MTTPNVLVAFASQTGSTAGIADVIAAELGSLGISVECHPATAVADVAPYGAVILGSGVFLPRRASDGGGFLARHREALAGKRVWLFCAGPIGRGRTAANGGAGEPGEPGEPGECAVMDVARSIGARGAAAFGGLGQTGDADPLAAFGSVDLDRVRWWAHGIAVELTAGRGRKGRAGGLAAVI